MDVYPCKRQMRMQVHRWFECDDSIVPVFDVFDFKGLFLMHLGYSFDKMERALICSFRFLEIFIDQINFA